jgi:hypothetical protein
MYYVYIVQSLLGRPGFGITKDPKERNKQYCSHCGDIVKFKFVYKGLRSHGKALETTIKKQYVDNIWIIDDWKTEWLNDKVSIDSFKEYVDSLILSRHLKLELAATDYDFRQEVNFN